MVGSDFLDTQFAVLDIGDCTITLHCADYMLTTSLTHDSISDWRLVKIVTPDTTETLCKQFKK